MRHAVVLRRFTVPFSNTRMRGDWIRSLGGKIVTGETEELGQDRVPGCPIQVPYSRSGNWTEALIVRSRQPNAAPTARPIVVQMRSMLGKMTRTLDALVGQSDTYDGHFDWSKWHACWRLWLMFWWRHSLAEAGSEHKYMLHISTDDGTRANFRNTRMSFPK